MESNWKKFVFIVCLLSMGLMGFRVFNRATILPESTTREEYISKVTATVADPKTSLRWRLAKLSLRQEPALETVPSAPVDLPADPDELREWARQNPEKALAWMRSAAAGEAHDTVVEIVCARVAESNPAEAVALAERYAGGCSNLLENLVHQWADQNESAARAYAINKPPGEERDRLLSRVAFTRSKENPADAAKLVAEWISPGEVQNEAAISVLHQWALRDPDAALAWAQLFPEESLRGRALKEVEVMVPKQPQ
jgi:hypothetical protein